MGFATLSVIILKLEKPQLAFYFTNPSEDKIKPRDGSLYLYTNPKENEFAEKRRKHKNSTFFVTNLEILLLTN